MLTGLLSLAWGWFTDAELIYKILELSNCCSKAWLSLKSSIPILGGLTDCMCLKASFDKVLRMKMLEGIFNKENILTALTSRSPDHSVVPCLLQLRGMCLCAVSGVLYCAVLHCTVLYYNVPLCSVGCQQYLIVANYRHKSMPGVMFHHCQSTVHIET